MIHHVSRGNHFKFFIGILLLFTPLISRADQCKELFKALHENRLEYVKEVLREEKEAVSNCKDEKDGKPFLVSVVMLENLELAVLALNYGAELEAKFGGPEKTALYYALSNSKLDILKLLLNKGANPKGLEKYTNSVIRKKLVLGHQENSKNPCHKKNPKPPLGKGMENVQVVSDVVEPLIVANIKRCKEISLQDIEKQLDYWTQKNYYRKRFIPLILDKLRDPMDRTALNASVIAFCKDGTNELVSIMIDLHPSKIKAGYLEIGFMTSSPSIKGGGRAALEAVLSR